MYALSCILYSIHIALISIFILVLGSGLEPTIDLTATFPNTFPFTAVFIFDSPFSIWLVFIIYVPGVSSLFTVSVVCLQVLYSNSLLSLRAPPATTRALRLFVVRQLLAWPASRPRPPRVARRGAGVPSARLRHAVWAHVVNNFEPPQFLFLGQLNGRVAVSSGENRAKMIFFRETWEKNSLDTVTISIERH